MDIPAWYDWEVKQTSGNCVSQQIFKRERIEVAGNSSGELVCLPVLKKK